MKLLDFEHSLLAPVVIFHRPSAEIELDDALFGKTALVEKIGEEHRDLSIWAHKPDHPQLNARGFLSLLFAEPLEVVVGRGEGDVVLFAATANESLHSREGALGRTAEKKVALVALSEIADEIKARVPAIEEQHAPGGNESQKGLSLFPLGPMDAHHAPGYGKAPEDIIGGGNQALGKVTSALILETALRIKLRPNLICCGKVVLGAIESYDRHPMPQIGRIARIETIGEPHGFLQNLSKEGPGNLPPSLGESASVDFLGVRPQAVSPDSPEKLTRFDVHSLALSAPNKREDEDDEFRKGKLSVAGEILGGSFGFGINLFGDEVEKSRKDGGRLA